MQIAPKRQKVRTSNLAGVFIIIIYWLTDNQCNTNKF